MQIFLDVFKCPLIFQHELCFEKRKRSRKPGRENIKRKRPELWKDNSWFPHYDKVLVHAADSSLLLQNKHDCASSTYSYNLVLADFSLFPKLKSMLKDRRFDTFEDEKKIRRWIYVQSCTKTHTKIASRSGNDMLIKKGLIYFKRDKFE